MQVTSTTNVLHTHNVVTVCIPHEEAFIAAIAVLTYRTHTSVFTSTHGEVVLSAVASLPVGVTHVLSLEVC